VWGRGPFLFIGANQPAPIAPNGREAAFAQIKPAKINLSHCGRLVVVITWRSRSTV